MAPISSIRVQPVGLATRPPQHAASCHRGPRAVALAGGPRGAEGGWLAARPPHARRISIGRRPLASSAGQSVSENLPHSPPSAPGKCKGPRPAQAATAPAEPAVYHEDEEQETLHPLQRRPSSIIPEEESRDVFGWERDVQAMYKVASRPVGRGAFGIVRVCEHRETGVSYALKSLPKAKDGVTTAHMLQKIRNEVQMLRMIHQSPYVVQLVDVFESDKTVHLVMELCRGGELWGQMQKAPGGQLPEDIVKVYMRSCLGMLEECHARGVLYRDIKPQNFMLMEEEGKVPEPRTLKAIDFGLSTMLSGKPLKKRAGTPAYMSPEVVMQNYGFESDMWSVGHMCFHMLAGRLAFWTDISHQAPAALWKGIIAFPVAWDALPEDLSPECLDFLHRILDKDGKQRLTLAEALAHPWLASQ